MGISNTMNHSTEVSAQREVLFFFGPETYTCTKKRTSKGKNQGPKDAVDMKTRQQEVDEVNKNDIDNQKPQSQRNDGERKGDDLYQGFDGDVDHGNKESY